MFIVGGLGIAASILVFAGHIYATYGRLVDETEEEEMQEALLLRMHDDNGSVGSDDTSDEEEGSDAVEDRAEPEAEVPDAQIQRGQINRTEPDQDENDEFSADRVVSGDHEVRLSVDLTGTPSGILGAAPLAIAEISCSRSHWSGRWCPWMLSRRPTAALTRNPWRRSMATATSASHAPSRWW